MPTMYQGNDSASSSALLADFDWSGSSHVVACAPLNPGHSFARNARASDNSGTSSFGIPTAIMEWAAQNLPQLGEYALPGEVAQEMLTAIKSLDALSQLEEGWDQARGKPINRNAIKVAKAFVAQIPQELMIVPQVVPMSNGRLQLEWHDGPQSLEIEFETPSLMHYLKWNSDEDVEIEDIIPVSGNWSAVNDLLYWFVQGRADAGST